VLGRQLAAPGLILNIAHDYSYGVVSQSLSRPLHSRERQQLIRARNQPTRVDLRHSWPPRFAEADGNRTRQTEMLDLTGFEDRGDHQEPKRLQAQTLTNEP
jgi:hypothetical protein